MRKRFALCLGMAVLFSFGCRPRPVLRPDMDELAAAFEAQFLASERVLPLIERARSFYEQHAAWPDQITDLSNLRSQTDDEPLDVDRYTSFSFEPREEGGLVISFTLQPFNVSSQGEQGQVYHVSDASGTVVMQSAAETEEVEAEVAWIRFVAERMSDGLVIDLSTE